MSDEPLSSTPPRPRRWVWILTIVAGVGIAGIAGYRSFQARRVQAELQGIRQAGYPATSSELDRWHSVVLIQENAALKIMEAADLISTNTPRIGELSWPERGASLNADQRTTFEQVLAANSQALALLHEGVSLPGSRYLVDWSRGLETLLPHLAKIKSLAQLLRAEAALALDEEKPQDAVRSINDSLSLARSLDTEPSLISQLVRLACLSITGSSLELVLTQHVLDEDHLLELAAGLAAAESQNQKAFTRALVGERCLGSDVFQLPIGRLIHVLDNAATHEQAILHHALSMTGMRDLDFVFYLRGMDDCIKASTTAFPDNLAAAKQAGDRIQTELSRRPFFVLSKMVLPALTGAMQKMTEGTARLRCAHLALAVERYRLKNNGQLPESLERLIPAFVSRTPTDPFDGNTLLYKRLAKGYVIYSVGKDGQDDGGTEPLKKSSTRQPSDLTFTVER